jgi:hypothetical protein
MLLKRVRGFSFGRAFMIKKILIQVCAFLLLFPSLSWCADQIIGNACYTYGDNESLIQGDQMAKTLAIRNALESYSIYVESTTQVTDYKLSSDLINAISAGQVKGVKVLKRLQSSRKICYTVMGYVEPSKVKTAIEQYLRGKNKSTNVRLQENDWIRILSQKQLPDETSNGIPCMVIQVDLEFLRYCKASQLEDSMAHFLFEHDLVEFMIQSGIYYRCSYQTNIFVTYYDEDGLEMGEYNKFARPERNEVVEIMPGQKLRNTIFIPKKHSLLKGDRYQDAEVKSYEVWVPR